MAFFDRIRIQKASTDHGYDGTFTQAGKGAPPPHLRDKNKSHSGQGAQGTSLAQETSGTAALDDPLPDNQATTDQ